jgi:hypothetical protein
MSTEKNNEVVRKRQEHIVANQQVKGIEKEIIEDVSYKTIKNSKKEAKTLGDFEKE